MRYFWDQEENKILKKPMKPKLYFLVFFVMFAYSLSAQTLTESQFVSIVNGDPDMPEKMWRGEKQGFEDELTCLLTHWMDVDGDQDLDMVILGRDRESNEMVKIFINKDGQYSFVQSLKSTALNIPEIKMMAGLSCSSNIMWCDQNNDGYKDFVLFQPRAQYQTGYYNNGDGTYTKMTEFVSAN